jgi:hypothetical protein
MRARRIGPGTVSALLALVAGCSLVIPLGDEYTFEECDVVPTQEEVCADHCGDLVVCGEPFMCGGCAGELACGEQTNVCACDAPPCAVTGFMVGDASHQQLVDVAVDGDGNVFFAGDFRGTVTFGDDTYTNPGATQYDMFLVKMDPNGNVLWSRAYGDVTNGSGDGSQNTVAIAADALGNVVLVGYSYVPVDLGGGELPVAGGDMVIVKLDKDGNYVFSASYGTQYSIDAHAIAIDPATQDILVTGKFWGTVTFGSTSLTAAGTDSYWDIFLVRFGPDGMPKAAKRYGDGSEQVPESIAVGGGYVFLSAYFNGTFNFGTPNQTILSTATWWSLALTRLSLSGLTLSHSWSRQYGEDVWDSRIAADTSGNLFVSGGFFGLLDIQDPPLDSDGVVATFLAKIGTSGETEWAKKFDNVWFNKLAVGPDGSVYAVGNVPDVDQVDLGNGPISTSGTYDPFIARYASDGTYLWGRVFDGPVGYQTAVSVAVAPDGSAWMGASFEGQVDFGLGLEITQGGYDAAVVKYAP